MPKVSILVPSYNHARFLPACMEGVLAQSFHDWELIMVDDVSSDDSLDIARGYSDPRIRVHASDKNLGTYATLQKALNLSSGELIAVLNSDDFWLPSKLALQVEALLRMPDVRFCYTLGGTVDAEGNVDQHSDVHDGWPKSDKQELLPFLLYENRVLASTVVFRRAGLRFDESCRYSGDWVALLEQAVHSPAACIPERLSFWRLHDTNTFRISLGQVAEEIRVRRAIMDAAYHWYKPRLDERSISRGLGSNAINLVALYVLLGRMDLARKAGVQAVKHHPDKRLALRRATATLLPLNRVRRHLWGERARVAEEAGASACRAAVDAIEPLRFHNI